MTATDYALPVTPAITNHADFAALPAWLGDFASVGNREFNHLDAMAASGDCFITLATQLDKIAQGLPQNSSEQIELENMVQVLFYLQDNWQLAVKLK